MTSTIDTGINSGDPLFGEGLSRTKKGASLLRDLGMLYGEDEVNRLRRKQKTPTQISKILDQN